MCRIKNLAILLGLCMVITACGSSEQQKSKVMLYQGDKNKKEEEHYKTTKVKKGTYEEKISATASLVYQNDKAVMIKDSNAYLDKILVKNGQKVVKGQKLATYHVKISDTKLKKKKLEEKRSTAAGKNNKNAHGCNRKKTGSAAVKQVKKRVQRFAEAGEIHSEKRERL